MCSMNQTFVASQLQGKIRGVSGRMLTSRAKIRGVMDLIGCQTIWTQYNPQTRIITEKQLNDWNNSGYLNNRKKQV